MGSKKEGRNAPFRVLFVCHGNICRSPMAESVFAYEAARRGLGDKVVADSAAAHDDEIGNIPHYGTRTKLREANIPLVPHRARLMTRADGEKYDLLVGMDEYNVRDMRRIVGEQHAGKVVKLLDFTPQPRSVADPWYTGDFEATYRDIVCGCGALLDAFESGRIGAAKGGRN